MQHLDSSERYLSQNLLYISPGGEIRRDTTDLKSVGANNSMPVRIWLGGLCGAGLMVIGWGIANAQVLGSIPALHTYR